MKQIAFIEYAFMFDPDSTWSNVHRFETDLSKFFKALGYEATVLNAVQGAGRRIIFITKIDDMLDEPKKSDVPGIKKGKNIKL